MMPWQKIKFPNYAAKKYSIPGVRLIEATLPGHSGLSIGVDPGVNFGLTIINMEYIQVFSGKLPSTSVRGQHAWDAMEMVGRILGYADRHLPGAACVEGAAYKDKFGQVGLEEVRIGFYLGLREAIDVHILPPMTIRKIAFGHGRTVAGELWPLLNHNAADSLGAALCVIGDIV